MIASAYESGRTGAPGAAAALNAAVNKVTDAVGKHRHIGGEPGSYALGLPRNADVVFMTLGESAVTFWNFGSMMTETPPTLSIGIPREVVASVTDTGSRDLKGHVRLTFTDGSYFDYQARMHPSPGFWDAADQY